MQRASLRCRTIWTPPRVSTGQKFRLPLSEEQVMDCALAGRAAIAISAMMAKTIPRNPRIRMRKASRGNPTREPRSVSDFCVRGD
jgi:hypothetical protein